MKVFVTGVGGLVGSAVAKEGLKRGYVVSGVEADFRGKWFGAEGSTKKNLRELVDLGVSVEERDFRDNVLPSDLDLIVHCAAQTSHDYSVVHPLRDFHANATGTATLLENYRRRCPEAVFVFLSTNKVYGDRVNSLDTFTEGLRFVPLDKEYRMGINEKFPIDASLHTPFGVSKLAADLMVQEYGRSYDLRTVCLRGGCLTGVGGAPVRMQGFLGYLVQCAVTGMPYTVFGWGGYQVRDNIDSRDVASAIYAVGEQRDRQFPQVYNLGGGLANSISVLEAIEYLGYQHGCEFEVTHGPRRMGDHKWWISDTGKFQRNFPDWNMKWCVEEIIDEMVLSQRRS